MKFFVPLFLLSWAVALVAADDIILKPLEGKVGTVSALYFAQGADIKTSQYVEILSMLQESVDFPLWVGIPQMPMDVAAIGLKQCIDRISEDMRAQGMEAEKNFYGGHSLGGAMMPDYVAANVPDTAAAMFLWGAFLTRKYKTGVATDGRPQVEFPVPTLTVGGEMDGLCRLTRVAEALYSQVTFSANPEHAATWLPVTVVEGMNHMEFASGDAPAFVLDHDLQAEISAEQAHALVVQDVSAWLMAHVHADSPEYMNTVTARAAESAEFVQPITDALLMESYEQFLPPCYCEAEDEYGYLQYGTCLDTPTCTGGVKWTQQFSQPIMAGLSGGESGSGAATDPSVKGLSMVVADSIHFVTEEDPSCHLPHVHGNPVNSANPGSAAEGTPPICAEPSGCTLNLTTVTQHVYHNAGEMDIWRIHFSVPGADTGYAPIAAAELNTKLKSRQAVWEAAGLANVSFTDTDVTVTEGGSADRCGEINQASIDWASAQLPQKTRQRFEEFGQKLVIGPDKSTCAAGPCWIWDNLVFEKDDAANTVNVQSVWFGTENVNAYPCGEEKRIPCATGFHYCKILSPARAIEWMYVDGLRNKLGTKQ